MRLKLDERFKITVSLSMFHRLFRFLGACLQGTWTLTGERRPVLNSQLSSQYSSSFICFMYRTGVACQILFDE